MDYRKDTIIVTQRLQPVIPATPAQFSQGRLLQLRYQIAEVCTGDDDWLSINNCNSTHSSYFCDRKGEGLFLSNEERPNPFPKHKLLNGEAEMNSSKIIQEHPLRQAPNNQHSHLENLVCNLPLMPLWRDPHKHQACPRGNSHKFPQHNITTHAWNIEKDTIIVTQCLQPVTPATPYGLPPHHQEPLTPKNNHSHTE